MATEKARARIHTTGEAPAQAAAETPSQTIINSAVKTGVATDELGRRLTVRRLSALDRMRLFAAAGAELSGNQQWIGLAALAASCVGIDGDQVPKPASRMQVEALVERLGDEGLNAIAEVYKETFGVAAEEDMDDDTAKAKN